MTLTVHDVARWWNWNAPARRRRWLQVERRPVDNLNFRYLDQDEMRDVFLLFARLQRPRSAR